MADINSSSSSSDEMFETDSEYNESSDDDLLQVVVQHYRKPKNERYFEDTIHRYIDAEFQQHFRINRHVVEDISGQFAASNYFTYQSGSDGKLNPLQHVLIFLWFAGHQTASFRDVADRFDISISTLFKVIKRMTYFLSGLSPNVIR